MDRPNPLEPASNGEPVALSFNLNQAAALCGVSVQQLQEWTDCGYIRVNGQGDRRRYDREALRQILAVRDAIQAGQVRGGLEAPTGAEATGSHIPPQPEPSSESRRPEEFSVRHVRTDDDHLALQAEMYLSLNLGVAVTAAQLSRRFEVPLAAMERVLESMIQERRITRMPGGMRGGADCVYCAVRAHLHGPNPREQRIRATHRPRIPSKPR